MKCFSMEAAGIFPGPIPQKHFGVYRGAEGHSTEELQGIKISSRSRHPYFKAKRKLQSIDCHLGVEFQPREISIF
ncbi:hypothetical protein VIGAN_11087300 [Vigna angularis var. angularis]|uniref:Uncharacterized protein n=1 Tax=Vigna angularis var. angularis TaxID=157739 RepID=A0A0S3T9C9_PHAAN|nr:hypothetical protein VIGAN_11087300 [Vigna angularis var. angularis]